MTKTDNTKKRKELTPEQRKRKNAKEKHRYHNDKDFREAKKSRKKEKYHNDEDFREAMKAYGREYYKKKKELKKQEINTDKTSLEVAKKPEPDLSVSSAITNKQNNLSANKSLVRLGGLSRSLTAKLHKEEQKINYHTKNLEVAKKPESALSVSSTIINKQNNLSANKNLDARSWSWTARLHKKTREESSSLTNKKDQTLGKRIISEELQKNKRQNSK